MFKQLEKNLTKLILISVSLMSFVVFVIVFLTFRQTTWQNNKKQLQQIFDRPATSMMGRRNAMGPMKLKEARYFIVGIDRNHQINQVQSMVDLSDQSLSEVQAIINQHPQDFSIVNINQESYMVYQGAETIIGFLNVNESMNNQHNLLLVLSSGFVLMLVITYAIARKFSKQALIPIEDSFDKQKRFIGDVSHEIKTPLSVIKSNIDLIEVDSNNQKRLDTINFEIKRMNQLINEMLLLSKSDHYQMIEKENVNLSELVSRAILSFEAKAFEKSIAIQNHIEPAIEVMSHPEKLNQLLSILLDNAIKYSPQQDFIEVIVKKKTLQIINTNTDLTDQQLPLLFDRFYRQDVSRERNNSYGLGLSIAKNIVDSLKHQIKVRRVNENKILFEILF